MDDAWFQRLVTWSKSPQSEAAYFGSIEFGVDVIDAVEEIRGLRQVNAVLQAILRGEQEGE